MAVIAPARDLVPVQGTILLHKSAAPAWETAKALSRNAYGIEPYITSPYGGHRSLAQQTVMWLHRKDYSAGVAFPGFSVHGSGLCVDVGNFRQFTTEQLDAAMNAAGFYRTIKSELWHYELRGGGSSSSAPKPEQSEEDDEMTTAILFHITSGASGTQADYRKGKDYGKGVLEHRTYNDQWFIQETPNGPLYWVEFSGVPGAYAAAKIPTVHRTGAELRDRELNRYGHVPQVGGPIVYEGTPA